jgi:transposase-like protein
LAKLKRLARIEDEIFTVDFPVSDEELDARVKDYITETPEKFAKKYRHSIFQPVTVHFNGEDYQIQLNRCTEPYCKWFGLPQYRFTEVKNKPSRYKLDAGGKDRRIECNPDPMKGIGTTWSCKTRAISNWSVAEEVSRLAKNDRVRDIESDYEFHKDGCSNKGTTPFKFSKRFYTRGKSTSNSQKWQCKECLKITNVMPTRKQASHYYQQRNDILLSFAQAFLNKMPINRICEMIGIGKQTYYGKLEWLYQCCLEFLENHETKALSSKHFKTLWINTDQMMYYLNPQRRRGKETFADVDQDNSHYQTRIIISGESFTRYILRSDVAFDWDTNLGIVGTDTLSYKEDHIYGFARKNARLRASYVPQPPSPNDNQTKDEYKEALRGLRNFNDGLGGLHVNSTYTAIAHYWLIQNMIHADNWRFVTDQDSSLMTALFRVFSSEVRLGDAHHFLCQLDEQKTIKRALVEHSQAQRDLKAWGLDNDLQGYSTIELALMKLEEELSNHPFHKMVEVHGRLYPKWANNPIEHPLPSADQGKRLVDCTTDVSNYAPSEVASMILKVNNHSTNAFIQLIRRRISFLERPLSTARNKGKSYIYANSNPQYAQYALTIFRTYYNFCIPFVSKDGRSATPAQRLGITDKCFTLKEIIYGREYFQ